MVSEDVVCSVTGCVLDESSGNWSPILDFASCGAAAIDSDQRSMFKRGRERERKKERKKEREKKERERERERERTHVCVYACKKPKDKERRKP